MSSVQLIRDKSSYLSLQTCSRLSMSTFSIFTTENCKFLNGVADDSFSEITSINSTLKGPVMPELMAIISSSTEESLQADWISCWRISLVSLGLWEMLSFCRCLANDGNLKNRKGWNVTFLQCYMQFFIFHYKIFIKRPILSKKILFYCWTIKTNKQHKLFFK